MHQIFWKSLQCRHCYGKKALSYWSLDTGVKYFGLFSSLRTGPAMTATEDLLWRVGGAQDSHGVRFSSRTSRRRDRDLRPQKSNISLISNGSMDVTKPFDEVMAWDRLPGLRPRPSAGFWSCRRVSSGWISGSSVVVIRWDLGEAEFEFLLSLFASGTGVSVGVGVDGSIVSASIMFVSFCASLEAAAVAATSSSLASSPSLSSSSSAALSSVVSGWTGSGTGPETCFSSTLEVVARFFPPFFESLFGLLHHRHVFVFGHQCCLFNSIYWPLCSILYLCQSKSIYCLTKL